MNDNTRLVRRSRRVLSSAIVLAAIALVPAARAQDCQPGWLPTFGNPPGIGGSVSATTVFDDGNGPALYAGGSFVHAAGVTARALAKWDGASWSAVGGNPGHGSVAALATFDDGTGPALYVAGSSIYDGVSSVSTITRWDGTSWSPLGSGTNGSITNLTVFDDGTGPALYAGGSFTIAGGVAAKSIAKWDGASWSPLGSGIVVGTMRALRAFDDGNGSALYVAGIISNAGGVAVNNIAKWNGSSWSTLGSGLNAEVYALTGFDDGDGRELYATGFFTNAGGVAVNRVAKWNGTAWSAVGAGLNSAAYSLTEFDDGTGPALYAGGLFTVAGTVFADRIARWNGTSWSALGTGIGGSSSSSVAALTAFDDGHGPALYASGFFGLAGDVAVISIARWRASSWSAVGGDGFNAAVDSLTQFDDGRGTALYAAGNFTGVGDVAASRVARWDGSTWSALDSGVNLRVQAMTVFDDGGGSALYATGLFTTAGGVTANRVAKWDGSTWSALGSGLSGSGYAMIGFDDGSGPALYVGGMFSVAGGVAAQGIARWNGSSWSPMGFGLIGAVQSLEVFDDGSGPALYAGHGYVSGGGTQGVIKKWNGSSWSAVAFTDDYIRVLKAYDEGSGPVLYAGGSFMMLEDTIVNHIARWDGSSWSALGGGTNALVYALTKFDDGSGPALYVSGGFELAGGVTAHGVARWDGANWSALGDGPTVPHLGEALQVFDDGDGPALYLAGTFPSIVESGDAYLAKWGNTPGCGTPGTSFCEPNLAGVIACPCANQPAASGLGCDNSSGSGGAQLSATGIARLTYDTLVFTTNGENPFATSIVLQGDAASASGVVFGQGVRCTVGNLKRMYVKNASDGSITVPQASDLDVHERSALLGDVIAAGTHRYYAVYYRDLLVLGGCPSSSTFNVTQQLDVLWAP